MNQPNHQSGNVFFLILAAVAMFAALAWVFTQNSRQSSGALTSEQSRLAAQEIIGFGNQLSDAVQKLKLRGCTDTQFNIYNESWRTVGDTAMHPASGAGSNPTAAPGCSLFAVSEGGIQPAVFPVSYTTGVTPGAASMQLGHSRVNVYAVDGVGTAGKEEIVLNLQRLNLNTCLKINEVLGIPNSNNTPPTAVAPTAIRYTGAFPDVNTLTDPTGVLTGKTAFCGFVSTVGYCFFQVLLAR